MSLTWSVTPAPTMARCLLWRIHLAGHGEGCAVLPSHAQTSEIWLGLRSRWFESSVECWSILPGLSCGGRSIFRALASATRMAAGRWQLRKSGGVIEPKRPHGSTSSGLSRTKSRMYPWFWERPRIQWACSVAATKPNADQESARQSVSTRRQLLLPGLLTWRAGAGLEWRQQHEGRTHQDRARPARLDACRP